MAHRNTPSMDTLKAPTPDQVLIVGAGPSGMILALVLLQNGIQVRIIEKNSLPRLGQRGAAIMPRSLELFASLGVIDNIMEIAIPLPLARMYKLPEGVEVLYEFEMSPSVPPSPANPFMKPVMLGQDKLEKILHAKLAEYGCSVELGTELISFQQTGECVTVQLVRRGMDPSAEGVAEDVNYKWMVGTDGARGVVRKLLGLSFLGETRSVENFVVGDIYVEGLSQSFWHMWGDAASTLISLRATETTGLFSFVLTGTDINHSALSADLDTLRQCIQQGTGNRDDLKFGEIPWISHYTPNIRMVDKFNIGRVFVAGDAAHVHSPTGGQGMNTGIQDSYNLGWKLALTIKKLAPLSLLQTYTEERLPVTSEMLVQTTYILQRTFKGKAEEPWKGNGSLYQLGVNYRWSSIVCDERKAIEVAQDAADDQYLQDYEYDDEENDSYGLDQDGHLRAGDRAPNATGLVKRIAIAGVAGEKTFQLFEVFGTSYHTVLIFPELSNCEKVMRTLSIYPATAIRPVVILRRGRRTPACFAGADFVYEDQDGSSHDAYISSSNVCGVIIIRPDGMVGAIAEGSEWIRRYFRRILA